MADVVCLGILVADVIARTVDRYPGRGELTLVEEMHPSIGGCAANTAIGLHKLGVSSGVMGKVGRDGFGDFVRGYLHRSGVDSDGISTDERAYTSATMVMIAADGERSFIHHTGANAAFTDLDVNWDLLQNCKLLHIAGHFLMPAFDGEPCARILKKARQLGIKTALDTAWDATDRWMQTLRPTLPYIDLFVPSYSEAGRCVPAGKANTPQDVAQFFLDQGVGVVALKMGERGSYLRTQSDEYSVAPFCVQAVDATGAGDAFAAGFLAGVAHGFDLPQCAELGNAVGALSVTQVGTVAGIGSLEETLGFIASQKADRRHE